MNLEKIDWTYLKTLRGLFTSDSAHIGGVYFSTDSELESYHQTLGARIGWKWESMLAEMAHRSVSLEMTEWTDWGCGSGVASLGLLNAGVRPQKINLWDHSAQARRFASRLLKKTFPELEVVELERAPTQANALLMSHVLNELPESEKNALVILLKNSARIFWVENGTRSTSRELSRIRDLLLETGTFDVMAPCSHNRACGMLSAENERHWCHSVAKVPSFAHQSAEWREVANRLSIDLRSLPMSFLVLSRKDALDASKKQGTTDSIKEAADSLNFAGELSYGETDVFRLIGEARHYKGYSKLLTCNGQQGVGEIILQKREVPELMKALQKAKFEAPLLKLELENEHVRSGVFI